MEQTFSIQEIDDIAKQVLDHLSSKIVLFFGDMGSGKTTLIKAILKRLGCKAEISSPTFSIVNEYELHSGIAYHFDFYRIEDENEAFDIGLEEYLYSGNWCFIEWPEKILNLLPDQASKIYLEIDGTQRNISFNF